MNQKLALSRGTNYFRKEIPILMNQSNGVFCFLKNKKKIGKIPSFEQQITTFDFVSSLKHASSTLLTDRKSTSYSAVNRN